MKREERTRLNDLEAAALIRSGRLTVDPEAGLVYAAMSKTPKKPIGTPNARGYLRTCITTKGKRVMLMVHRIIWIAAHGVPRLGHQVNHKDGLKANNALPNLEIVTPGGNVRHAKDSGLWEPNFGLRNGFAKLSEADVVEIRQLRATGVSAARIAAQFGISEGYTRRLAKGTARGGSSSRT